MNIYIQNGVLTLDANRVRHVFIDRAIYHIFVRIYPFVFPGRVTTAPMAAREIRVSILPHVPGGSFSHLSVSYSYRAAGKKVRGRKYSDGFYTND